MSFANIMKFFFLFLFKKIKKEVGAGIDDDIYFVDLVKRAWKLY